MRSRPLLAVLATFLVVSITAGVTVLHNGGLPYLVRSMPYTTYAYASDLPWAIYGYIILGSALCGLAVVLPLLLAFAVLALARRIFVARSRA